MTFMRQKVLYFLLFFIFSTDSLTAQEVPKVLNFTKSDYHAQNQNWMIAQSPADEMFFGNGEGLLRYDGAFWQNFSLPNKQIVRSVACDNRGRVFVGGFAEFGFWEQDIDGLMAYTSLSKRVKNGQIKKEKTDKEEIWNIIVHRNKVYFQSFSTIYCFDESEVTVLSPAGSIMFLHNVNGRLLFQVIEKGLYELTDDNDFRFIEKSNFLVGKIVSTIVSASPDSYLVGTSRDGIFKFENNLFTIWNTPTQHFFKDFQLNKGLRLASGNFAFGTILNGIFILQPDGSLLSRINKENGLQNNTVISMLEDRAHNLWLGLDKGIDLVDLNTPLKFFQDRSGKTGAVYAAAFYNDNFYIGTNQGVFYRKKGQNTEGVFQLVNGTQGQIWDLKVFDNQLLCGQNNGTCIIRADNSIAKVYEGGGGWYTIRSPSTPDFLIQGTYTGIVIFKKNGIGQWSFYKKMDGYSEPTKKIGFDKKGNLWAINAYNQLFKLRLSTDFDLTDSVRSMKLPTGDKVDFDLVGNEILFKSGNHFYTFNSNENGFRENPNNPPAYCKLREMNGDLLKIYNDYVEINHFDKQKSRFRLKLIPDYETVVAIDSSHYLFGMDDGYAIFDRRAEQPAATYKPRPIIRLGAKDGRIFSFYPTNKNKNAVQLPPQYRELRVDFALPFYTDLPKFQYLLTEHSADWSLPESAPSREFANLSTGKHIFRLKNDITDEETQIEFEILPHWYERTLAKVFYLAILFGLVFLLQTYHQRQLREQRQKFEAEKQRELAQQQIQTDNEKLHFEVFNKSKELANSTMSIIRKNEILMEIKDELGDIKNELGARFPEKHYSHLKHIIDVNLTSEENWKVFEENFNGVHQDFLQRLKHDFPDLTPGDLRLAAYLRMNLSSKEISPLLYISVRGVENKRYRLRKKMGLSEEANLTEFVMNF